MRSHKRTGALHLYRQTKGSWSNGRIVAATSLLWVASDVSAILADSNEPRCPRRSGVILLPLGYASGLTLPFLLHDIQSSPFFILLFVLLRPDRKHAEMLAFDLCTSGCKTIAACTSFLAFSFSVLTGHNSQPRKQRSEEVVGS